MSLKKDYRAIQQDLGGIGCTCCNSYNCHPRNMKALTRRVVRRANKQEIKNLQKEDIYD